MSYRLISWPKGFTKGKPTETGCYVLLSRDYDAFVLSVKDIEYIDPVKDKCLIDVLDVEPGLCVSDPVDTCYWTLDEFEIIGYKKLFDNQNFFDIYHSEAIEFEGEQIKAIKDKNEAKD